MTLAVPELSSPEAVAAHLTRRGDLCGVVIEAVDLRECGLDWDALAQLAQDPVVITPDSKAANAIVIAIAASAPPTFRFLGDTP